MELVPAVVLTPPWRPEELRFVPDGENRKYSFATLEPGTLSA